MTSGGDRIRFGPETRTIRPRSVGGTRHAAGMSLVLGSGVRAGLSATISMPSIRPWPRTSPTKGTLRPGRAAAAGRPATLRHVARDVALAQHVQRRQGGGCSHRMRAVGVAVGDLGGAAGVGVEDTSAMRFDDGGGAQRDVAAADALGQAPQVGLHAPQPGAEHRAAAAEAGDHLVGDQQHAMAAQTSRTSGQKLAGGTITPPAPWIGSAMKAATVSGPWKMISRSSCAATMRPSAASSSAEVPCT
jgi:hypothetical protein